MPASKCVINVDSRGMELARHGSSSFPIACYNDNLMGNPVPWHWHEEVELGIITAGECTVAVGKKKYRMKAGQGFFINSGILHSCWSSENTECRFYSLVFHPRLVGGSLDSVFYREYVAPVIANRELEGLVLLPSVPWNQDILHSVETAWQQCCGKERGYEFLVREALSRLIWTLWEHLPSERTAHGAKTMRDGERLKTMISFLREHWSEELDTRAIAASAAISESECLRCFRSTIGMPPIRYLRDYRLQQAAAMLRESNLRIADVAARCGFPDASYFTKTFRESRGCTPSEYRIRQGNAENSLQSEIISSIMGK